MAGLPHRFCTSSQDHSGAPVVGVQRPQDPLAAAQVLAHGRVDRHGRHVHGAVVVAGGHVDALVVVADQRPAPQLPAGGRRQGDRGVVRRRVHHPAGHVDAVRAAVERAVVVRPQDLAGGELDRHHVRLQVLQVHHAVHHDRRRRVTVGEGRRCRLHRSTRPARTTPRPARDIRAGDRAGDVPRVRQVAARQRPARRDRRVRRAARRAAGLPARRVLGGAARRTRCVLLLLAQPPAASPAATVKITPATAVRLTPHLIWLISCIAASRPDQTVTRRMVA